MLPWLIPIYFAALICGFIAMQVYKTTKWKVAIWIVIASVSLSLIAAVALHPPHVEGGPGGLTGFNGIPNLAVFVICGGVLIALFVTRPPPEAIYSKFGLIVVLLCLLVEVTVANIPELWGFYPLKIHVVDWQGRSLAGIRMNLSEERTGLSLEQAFLSSNVQANLTTDSAGNVTYTANKYRSVFCMINNYWQKTSNANLGGAGFQMTPYASSSQLIINWTAKGQQPGTNNRWYSTTIPNPYLSTLTIFLPAIGGENESPYPSAQYPF